MNTETIKNALHHLDSEEQDRLAEAIERAYDMICIVRTGTDFECECHDAARALRIALRITEEE